MARLRFVPVEYKVCPQCSVDPPAVMLTRSAPVEDITTVRVGGFVLHERYGPAVFRGLERLHVERTEEEYLCLEYTDGVLYLPARSIHQLRHPRADVQLQPASFVAFQMKYEGDACPQCREQAEVTTPRRLYKRLILTSVYERQKRFRCPNPECRHLYELPSDWEKGQDQNAETQPLQRGTRTLTNSVGPQEAS